jgi:hypothetical protein
MARSNDVNNVPEGTTLVFGSWANTADGSGGFSSHLIMPKTHESKTSNQSAKTYMVAELDGKQTLLELDSDTAENMSTPTRAHELAEFDTNSDSENPHFSETLGKYVAYLKSIKRPKIVNLELLDGVDRVSRSIEGCIKLAESALNSSKTQQNPETLNPPHERSGDMLSGIDRVESKLIDCIKMAESTQQSKKQNSGGEFCGKLEEANPRLAQMGPSPSGKPQNPSPKPAHKWTPEPTDISDPYSIRISTSPWKVWTTTNYSTISTTGQTTSTCLWTPWPIHPRWQMLSGN